MTQHREKYNGLISAISSFLHTSRFAILYGSLIFILSGMGCASLDVDSPRTTDSLDQDWLFYLGDVTDAAAADYDDNGWRLLDLPHDWSIEDLPQSTLAAQVPINSPATGRRGQRRVNFQAVGPFSPQSPGGKDTGYTLGGTGWYRKHFVLDEDTLGKHVVIEFDGIYMDSDVWLNGHHLGNHPYGYTAFAYDLTDFLNPPGRDNVIAVRVRNLGRNSRWYTGSGIYRRAAIRVTDPLRIGQWGVYITTPEVTEQKATVNVVTTVKNGRSEKTALTLRIKLRGPKGKTFQTGETKTELAAGDQAEFPLELEVTSPPLWSTDSPELCQAEVTILVDGKAVDTTTTTFGIRDIKFSVDNGFTLNGEEIKLRGACLHHDNGILGSAAFDRAEERKVELMKANGYNAIRTSHNPPSTALLDTCDRLGILVMDEAFDCWEEGKNPDDYGKYFNEWWQRDLESMILRDRNHPCVIMWSIGNEVPQRVKEEGYVIEKKLCDEVKRLDPTRPVTEAICAPWDGQRWPATEKAFSFLDVGGYNYQPGQYESDHQKYPNRIIVGTESFPRDFAQYWRGVENNSYVLGDFVWTGMDYLGEAALGSARVNGVESGEYFNAFCGDLDLCGFKKAQSYYRDVVLDISPLEIFVHRPIPEGGRETVSAWGWPDELASWTWPGNEGKTMQVNVYSKCDSVRLELNGMEIATKQVDSGRLTARFDVPYASGELKAVGLTDEKIIATKVLKTVGPAEKVKLTVDRSTIAAERDDLAYVTVEITDDSGNIMPDATNMVHFTLSGPGELIAVGSGAPDVMESFRQPQHTTWHGRCLAIIRPKGDAGTITLKAESEGLKDAKIVIRTN